MLSSYVCLSVRHKAVLYQNVKKIELFCGIEASFDLSYIVLDIWVPPNGKPTFFCRNGSRQVPCTYQQNSSTVERVNYPCDDG